MKKKLWLIAALIAFFLAAGTGFYLWQSAQEDKNAQQVYEEMQGDTAAESSAPAAESLEASQLDIPVDFKALKKENPDIYAWITIPGTVIDYPIVQNPEDNYFYLDHAANREEFRAGAIYTERYNALDFSDPITLVYGHNMKDGSMFAGLHQYEDMEFLTQHPDITIYTPHSILHYSIFAALRTDDSHRLMRFRYGETDKDRQAYLKDILSERSMEASILYDAPVDETSRILTLSTCDRAGPECRYVVHAYLTSMEEE